MGELKEKYFLKLVLPKTGQHRELAAPENFGP